MGPHWSSEYYLNEVYVKRVQTSAVKGRWLLSLSYSKTHYDSGGYCLPFRKLKDYYEDSKRAVRLLKKLLERSLQRHEPDPLLIHVCGSERALVKDWLFDESIRASDPLADFYLEKKKSERNGWIITIWNNAGSGSDELARIWHIAMRIWYCTTWGLKIWRIKEKTGWRTLLLLTMSSNNKCWGAVDSLLPFAVKKTTPFYIGCAPEYKIWYNNNNKTIPPFWEMTVFFYNILNNALKKWSRGCEINISMSQEKKKNAFAEQWIGHLGHTYYYTYILLYCFKEPPPQLCFN